MKKLLILLLVAILLCGCAGKKGEEPTADTSASPPETVPPPEIDYLPETVSFPGSVADSPMTTTQRDVPSYPSQYLKINAVVLTWGEPIPKNSADYDEVTSNAGVAYIKVRASFDEVYFSTFEMHNSSRYPFTIPNEIIMKHLEDFVYVPKYAVNQFSAGKKQLVFLESFNNNFCIGTQKEENDTVRITSQAFDIVDGRICVPKKYFVPFHDRMKKDYPDFPLFEDGMLVSDFGPYIERILSYETTTCIK